MKNYIKLEEAVKVINNFFESDCAKCVHCVSHADEIALSNLKVYDLVYLCTAKQYDKPNQRIIEFMHNGECPCFSNTEPRIIY